MTQRRAHLPSNIVKSNFQFTQHFGFGFAHGDSRKGPSTWIDPVTVNEHSILLSIRNVNVSFRMTLYLPFRPVAPTFEHSQPLLQPEY